MVSTGKERFIVSYKDFSEEVKTEKDLKETDEAKKGMKTGVVCEIEKGERGEPY